VAGRRIDPAVKIPEVPPYPSEPEEGDADKWLEQYHAQLDAVDEAARVPIGLPYDGAHFNEPSRQATLERVRELRALGYRCPDRVEERLLEEIKEEEAGCE